MLMRESRQKEVQVSLVFASGHDVSIAESSRPAVAGGTSRGPSQLPIATSNQSVVLDQSSVTFFHTLTKYDLTTEYG